MTKISEAERGERESGRQRETERQRRRGRERQRERQRDRDRERERQRERQRWRGRERQRERETGVTDSQLLPSETRKSRMGLIHFTLYAARVALLNSERLLDFSRDH